MEKMAKHPEIRRLTRAVGQYALALDNWRLGKETLALAHLWMGMEAAIEHRGNGDASY